MSNSPETLDLDPAAGPVELTRQLCNIASVSGDERRTLRARWQLVDTANGSTLVDASAASDTGIDVVGSEYATIAAERSALERLADDIARQIVARIAVFADRSANPPPGTP